MRRDAIIRLIVVLVTFANQALVAIGWEKLPWEGEEVGEIASGVVAAGAAVWAWWKNNSITKPAIDADRAFKLMKSGKLAYHEIEAIVRNK